MPESDSSGDRVLAVSSSDSVLSERMTNWKNIFESILHEWTVSRLVAMRMGDSHVCLMAFKGTHACMHSFLTSRSQVCAVYL